MIPTIRTFKLDSANAVAHGGGRQARRFVFVTGVDDDGVSVFQVNNVGLLVKQGQCRRW